jgi:hypothetical protein
MDLDTSTYISDSVLQASIARATTTTGRTSQLAAYIRLNSDAEHAGGVFSGNIELHVPSTIKQVRIGCDHNPILDDSVVLCDAWVVLTGVYKSKFKSDSVHVYQQIFVDLPYFAQMVTKVVYSIMLKFLSQNIVFSKHHLWTILCPRTQMIVRIVCRRRSSRR